MRAATESVRSAERAAGGPERVCPLEPRSEGKKGPQREHEWRWAHRGTQKGCRRPGQEERARPRVGRGPACRHTNRTPLEVLVARLAARPRDRVGPDDRGPREGPSGRGTPRGWALQGCRRPGQEERARPRIGRGPARRHTKRTPLEAPVAQLGAQPRDRGEDDFPDSSESKREYGDLWSGARSRGCGPTDS
ncbi:hypothetical protein NDU88_001494 [Pleurodeles waltl]|uniref:Uncharacterized protein n=1 Tax=Pleurodeles waltl TaxID=8319 RepID=A0AAV7KQE6_PLEWA|nr:hypothetical protein NDU88_001494 [Pleurodeles waltl]